MPSNEVKKVPPHSQEGEMAVIASILIDNKALDKVTSLLEPADFYHPSHQYIYARIIELHEANKPVDVVNLISAISDRNELGKAGGLEYISSLVDIVPTAANIESYAQIVKDKSMLRAMIGLSVEMSEMCYEQTDDVTDIVEAAEKKIFKLAENKLKSDIKPIGNLMQSTFEVLEKLYKRKDDISGVPSGFNDLDDMTNGWQNSDLIILAARPAMGKTAFSLNITLNAAYRQKKSVAFFSLEMSDQQLVQRLLSSMSEVDSSKLRSGKFTMEEWQKLAASAGELHDTKFFIDDTPAISPMELRAKCRRLKREHDLDLVIVDYLQLMGSNSKIDSREQQISEISRSLKGLAKELNIPVIALSQLNRGVESRTDKRPVTSDLRESGAIEQDADIIIFLYRDEVYTKEQCEKPGVAEIIIAKHRNGATGTVELYFQKEFTRFQNLAHHPV